MAPFDSTNSTNPYLINMNKDELILKDGVPLSAEYIWSHQGKDRDDLVEWVCNYYINKGFPFILLSNNELWEEYNKIVKKNPNELIVSGSLTNEIQNTSPLGLEIARHFCGSLFFNSKRNGNKSSLEVFNDLNILKKVIQNRMGYNISREDGTERPYVFGINDKMILQGMKSSGLASTISQFKPNVAKLIYSLYTNKGDTVLDYSAGWGARLLGAMSLNLKYIGIDPLTSECLNKMTLFFNGSGSIIDGLSEDSNLYKNIEPVDFIFSSPPYFNMELYSNNINQCYNSYKSYDEWLNNYWENTVLNCKKVLKKGKCFGLCVVEKYGKLNLAEDMSKTCVDNGLIFHKKYPMKTNKSHLTSKKNNVSKNNDVIYIFKNI